jgi:protein SCO1/2
MKKSNYSYIGIAFIILLFGIIFVPKIVDRIKNKDVTRDGSRSLDVSNETFTKIASNLDYLVINDKRKKVPEFSFTDQNGKIITNTDYLGKVYVVEFFFTTCPTICPRMNRNLVSIQNELKGLNEFKDFGVASFSIMPETDTSEVLKAYADSYGIENPNWHMLTGKPKSEVYELSNVGFNIFVDTDNFEHSGDFALVDKNGYLRSRKDDFGNPKIFYKGIISEQEKIDEDGNEQEITMLIEDIKALLKE